MKNPLFRYNFGGVITHRPLGLYSMASSNSEISAKRPSSRLLFDRRYGWVFDEWKDPFQEALAGGRGMFCILPLATSFLNTASDSISHVANFALKVYERPDLLSPRPLQENLHKQLEKFNSILKKPESSSLTVRSSSQTATFAGSNQVETVKS